MNMHRFVISRSITKEAPVPARSVYPETRETMHRRKK